MVFDAPLALALAPLAATLYWLAAAWARRVRLRRAAQWSDETLRRARVAGRFGPVGVALATLLAVSALAGPRWGQDSVVTETRGLNLVIAVDISRSMLAEDAEPNRLGRSLREARRLVQDLEGDRLGLIAFAGSSFILSPLSLDGSAVTLHLDALDPDVASEGGTQLAPVLGQGGDLLRGSTELADRVLVVFTDGEAHDSVGAALEQARRLGAAGVHVILVAQGRASPVRIPIRDNAGTILRYQADEDGQPVETRRRDDVLNALANAARGTIVGADLPDQAGAVRELVAAFKRSRSSETRIQQGRPRAWIPLLGAVGVLLLQAAARRTAALIGIALILGVGVAGATGVGGAQVGAQTPRHPRTAAEKAWDGGDRRRAADAYRAGVGRDAADTARYNAGTAALAAGDAEHARPELEQAATSLDPDMRFRALYNLGLLSLTLARTDSIHRQGHLADAERAYREALRLKPRNLAAKWNLELAVRQRRGSGGGASPPPRGGGEGGPAGNRQPAGENPRTAAVGGLSQAQAEEILRSIGQEELRTRRDRANRTRRATPSGVKDW
ncbi:MAG TPA: VWA domain-containing protein [Gemmatimonadales bacterium]